LPPAWRANKIGPILRGYNRGFAGNNTGARIGRDRGTGATGRYTAPRGERIDKRGPRRAVCHIQAELQTPAQHRPRSDRPLFGSLHRVLARILDGNDYIVKVWDNRVEVARWPVSQSASPADRSLATCSLPERRELDLLASGANRAPCAEGSSARPCHRTSGGESKNTVELNHHYLPPDPNPARTKWSCGSCLRPNQTLRREHR
jgi:hypothetical protein